MSFSAADLQFAQLYIDGAYHPATWQHVHPGRRRRVDPDAQGVVGALVRGWCVPVDSRARAEAVLAKVAALPLGEPLAEPAALLAWPGWNDLDDGRVRQVVVGAILAARTSDQGEDGMAWLAQGPAGAPLAVFRAREQWADAWLPAAFAGLDAAIVGAPATFFVAAGGPGDAFLALGDVGAKIAGLPFSKRTADHRGKKHKLGMAGMKVAHAAWDEQPVVPVDLSAAGLAKLLAKVTPVLPEPKLVLSANYDARS